MVAGAPAGERTNGKPTEGGCASRMSAFEDAGTAVPLERTMGHGSQVSEQQADAMSPADHAQQERNPIRATIPMTLRCGPI